MLPADALHGLKVLELGQLIAGPFAGKTLADFGADVLKIEPVDGGDPLRTWRLLREGTSVWWEVQSRNKRSVALDLKSAEGQAVVRRLAAEADVLIENFKPGTLEGWNLAPEALREANPRLIVLRISGFGQTGPYAHKPGFGVLGGQVQVFVTTPPSVMGHVQAGKLKAFAVTGKNRHPGVPNVPTVAEAGLPGFELEAWVALFAPAGTPPAVVQQLSTQVKAALATPEAKAVADKSGIEIRYLDPAGLQALVDRETKYWGDVIKARNIKAD